MGFKYSIDNVVLRAEILSKDYINNKGDLVREGFNTFVSPFGIEPRVSYKKMSGISAYEHNFNIKDYNMWGEECSFWIGCGHNSRPKGQLIDVTLDYNPNKCDGSELLDYVLNKVFRNNSDVEVRKFDLAIDIPCNILDIAFAKANRSYRLFDNGCDDKTHYFGSRGSDGSLKIYNKKRESKLSYDLTRYELTLLPKISICSMLNYSFDDSYIHPITLVNGLQLDMELSGQDKFNVLAALDNPMLLSLLEKRKASKIKKIINSLSPVSFDTKQIEECVGGFFRNIYQV